MSTIYSVINLLGFPHLMGLFVLVFVVHELEEWNITDFERRNFVGLPPTVTKRNARLWIAIICTVAVVWCAAAVLSGNATIAGYIFLPAIFLALGNTLQQIFWTVYFKQYAPGVVTAVLLVIPVGSYVVYRAVQEWGVSLWYAALFLLLIIFNLAHTIREGKKASPMISTIYGLGDRLGKTLSR